MHENDLNNTSPADLEAEELDLSWISEVCDGECIGCKFSDTMCPNHGLK